MSAVTYATAQILRVLPRARIGRAIGRLAERPWSPPIGRAVVGLYSRVYDVRLDECMEQEGWPNFDAFFTRRLRAGARPVDPDPRAITSPADGRIESLGTIDGRGTFLVKGRPYAVEELVGDSREAGRFVGGVGCVVYLSPRDYHRVHSPVSGHVRRIRSMPGDYYPVNAVGMRHVANLFCRNRRVAIEIETSAGFGRVTIVMVVAMIVGRITTIAFDLADTPIGDHVFDPPLRVGAGEELGVFHLGSTAVVLAERSAAGAWLVSPGPVRCGQALLRAPAVETTPTFEASGGASG
ncbi:MAG: archaetidylserine decarboxylase [Myxococcota bacterium]|nr:archaetidylserine decarboxylase [Myxococcota bacterium]